MENDWRKMIRRVLLFAQPKYRCMAKQSNIISGNYIEMVEMLLLDGACGKWLATRVEWKLKRSSRWKSSLDCMRESWAGGATYSLESI